MSRPARPRYRAEIAAQTLDYQGAGNQALLQSDQPAVEVSMHQPAEAVVPAEEPAKPKRRRRICRDLIVDVIA